jgi:hypothetical protein
LDEAGDAPTPKGRSLPGTIVLGLYGLGVLPYVALGFLAVGVWLRRLGFDATAGLLALAPIAALGLALVLSRRRGRRSFLGVLVLGGGLAFVALAIVDHSRIWFEATIHLAYAENPSLRAEAVEELRSIGSAEEVLGRVSKTGRGWNPLSALVTIARGRRIEDFASLMVRSLRMTSVRPREDFWGRRPGPVNDFDELMYRVTGRLPNYEGDAFLTREEFEEDYWGEEDRPGWRSDVVLLESRITGRIEPDEGWALFEWSLAFENRGNDPEFTEATLALPSGAVVTKAALEVDGTTRDAVLMRPERVEGFAGLRSTSPLLLAGVGVDRVWFRANGLVSSRMSAAVTIRLTFAAEILPVDAGRGRLGFPSILTRSFALGQEVRHEIVLEIPRAPASLPEGFELGVGAEIRAVLSDDRLAERGLHLTTPVPPVGTLVRGLAPMSSSRDVVSQSLLPAMPAPGPMPLVIVVDGSRDMAPHAEVVAEFIARLPGDLDLAVVLAEDEVVRLTEGCVRADRDVRERVASRLREFSYAGGADQLPALLEARRLAAGGREGAILWIHTPQPLQVSHWRVGMEILRALPGTPITGLAVAEGHCVVSAALQGQDCRYREWAGEVSVAERLEQIRRAWFLAELRPIWRRECVLRRVGEEDLAPALVALWARDAVRARLHRDGDRSEALRLSKLFGILTPASVAVVLAEDE